MPADGRAALLHDLYGAEGLNLSTARACIGSSDYATHLFSYDEGAPDPELARFSIAPDRPAVIPVLKALRAARPDLFLFASPWSPPGWMKYGGSMKGGSIRPENLAVYARYIGKYLDAYAAEGLPVQAVTVQNEIDADQGGRMPAAAWPQETDTLYMSEHLGPELAQRGGRTQLWMLDHNYDLAGRVMDQLAKPAVAKVVDAVAWHGYVGEPEAMSRVHAAFPAKGAHWTEGGAMVDDPDYLTGWTKWAQTIAGVLNNQAQSFTVWNAALDEHGRPNIGPFTCGGLVTVRSGDHSGGAHGPLLRARPLRARAQARRPCAEDAGRGRRADRRGRQGPGRPEAGGRQRRPRAERDGDGGRPARGGGAGRRLGDDADLGGLRGREPDWWAALGFLAGLSGGAGVFGCGAWGCGLRQGRTRGSDWGVSPVGGSGD